MLEAHLGRCADCREFEAAVAEFTTDLRAAPLEPLARPAVVIPRRRGFSVIGAQVGVAAAWRSPSQALPAGWPPMSCRRAAPALAPGAPRRSSTTSWQPERELANLADAPKARIAAPGARRRPFELRGVASRRERSGAQEKVTSASSARRAPATQAARTSGTLSFGHIDRPKRPSVTTVNVFPNHA